MDSAQAWTTFWQESGPDSHCLAGASPDVQQALDEHWLSFAGALALDSHVLDIGCGAGAVGRCLLAAQPHVRITGIDFATIPPPADLRIEVLSGTPMESLPFPSGSFDAVVSQFGVEYGQVKEAAEELARVLIPGAPFSFIVHHAESSIVSSSSTRRKGIRDIGGKGLKKAFLTGNAAALDRHTSFLRRQYPGEDIVDTACQAFRSHIEGDRSERATVWKDMLDALAPERMLLGALESSCVAPAELECWIARLDRGFEIKPPSVLRAATGEPIAWKIEGARKTESTGVIVQQALHDWAAPENAATAPRLSQGVAKSGGREGERRAAAADWQPT